MAQLARAVAAAHARFGRIDVLVNNAGYGYQATVEEGEEAQIRAVTDGHVTFAWKDYRHESRNKTMCLDAPEFVRRFLLHVLPTGFQRIRHYGLLAHRYREVKLERCRQFGGTHAAHRID